MKRTKAEPAVIVIFGVMGDLSHRKLMPALYELTHAKELAPETAILGVGRRSNITDDMMREEVRKAIEEYAGRSEKKINEWCDSRLFYHSIDGESAEDYTELKRRIEELETSRGIKGNRVFYLALPPTVVPNTIESLGEAGLNTSSGWTRVVVEKPFGSDLASAKSLDDLLHKYFTEEQIYRIDHYLGKETVQNLLTFRFANALFESVWNRDKIEKIEITVNEELGVESRADYYEHSGALRDMIQNHLTQLLALIAMEVPGAFEAEAIRYEKVKVIKAITPIKPNHVVLGQYAAGEIDGKTVPGYTSEKGVDPQSKVETFVALKLFIESWRWHGVPFYLRTGKRLQNSDSEIRVSFHCPPIQLFKEEKGCVINPNVLVIALRPDEGFRISFEVKKPGPAILLQTEWMHFTYAEAFGPLADGYQTLLYDILIGDQTLFVSSEETLASWRLYDPVIAAQHEVHPYPAGSLGPPEVRSIK